MNQAIATPTGQGIALAGLATEHLPATVPPGPGEPLPPPKPSWLQDVMASDAGVGLKRWMNGIGAGLGYIAPAAMVLGSAYYTSHMPGSYSDVATAAAVVSIGGSVLQAVYQGWDGDGAIDTYRKAQHPNPRWASFRDVMGYFALPAIVASTLVGAFVSPGLGIAAGTITALGGMSLALTTHFYRIEKYGSRDL